MTKRNFVIIAAVISAFVIALPFACNEKLCETYYTVKSDKVTSPVKIAFLSDLHSSLYGHDMSELIASVEGFAPDIVVFGGDLFKTQWGEENAVMLVKQLTNEYRCFYSIGNHEIRDGVGFSDEIKREMRANGVTVLDGQYADTDGLRIHGIDGGAFTDQLESCESAIAPDKFNILINHYPEEFPKLSEKGFDLILSGHAHGGQVRIPPFVNGLYSPGEGLFPKYTSGEHFANGSEIIISRGLARSLRDLVAPRVFNRPEAVYITITK